ncbi:hypothetical protein [Thioflexithrix psekupsensis]|uniref:Uncharacterized protein n=1 Tax=Thioflexithrix psekupsensis TaxID=1570016 RepID=A0A251XC01_9GAMM|nr:hypothetical protein [Thioflexithrix psekupsensis]OUD16257.1 hypothetical protein TPSD3_00600 [Thioflexithrix psekupsensis]
MAMLADTFPLDVRAVLTTARTLHISEFEVFRLAYQKWYGQHVDTAQLENFFVAYLFDSETPHWVRHFTSQVMALKQEGIAAQIELDRLEIKAQINQGLLIC